MINLFPCEKRQNLHGMLFKPYLILIAGDGKGVEWRGRGHSVNFLQVKFKKM